MLNLQDDPSLFIEINEFPMPPTANRQLIWAPRQKRFIKSGEARRFSNEVLRYKSKNRRKCIIAGSLIDSHLKKYKAIRVEIDFIFPWEKIFARDGKIKILDTNNRIKAAIDGLCEILDFDDKFIFSESHRKISCKKIERPYLNARILSSEITQFIEHEKPYGSHRSILEKPSQSQVPAL